MNMLHHARQTRPDPTSSFGHLLVHTRQFCATLGMRPLVEISTRRVTRSLARQTLLGVFYNFYTI